MAHRHERGDEEGLIANLREEDHGEGEDEGVEGLDDALWLFFSWGRGGVG